MGSEGIALHICNLSSR